MADNTHAKPIAPKPKPVDVGQEERDARYRASRGAQVILDPNSDASLGARGGAGGSIQENEHRRDAHLLSHNLDPRDPDASHLPDNAVPAGGAVMDHVSDDLEPTYQQAQK